MQRRRRIALIALAISLILPAAATACGGLFCQTVPVDQQAERIIFTINGDGTISAYVQINYTGSAPDFSWVVPVPTVPEVGVAEMASFDELSSLTAPVFLPPPVPTCALRPEAESRLFSTAAATDDVGVEVLAQGTAGPYAYEVVTSEDPKALVVWLREHRYQITREMEPLVDVYTREGAVFLAMRLLPEAGTSTQDIQPVVMTYRGLRPTIPIRLTAVAANPNMSIVTWIFADARAIPHNYAHPRVDERNLRNSPFSSDGTNYLSLLDRTVDLFLGRAFVTEYADGSAVFLAKKQPQDPLVVDLARRFDYVTRLFGRMSPEEMTRDPVFRVVHTLPPVTNIHDLANVDAKVYWGCVDRPIVIGSG